MHCAASPLEAYGTRYGLAVSCSRSEASGAEPCTHFRPWFSILAAMCGVIFAFCM